MTRFRRNLADWLDPDRAHREVAANKRAMRYRTQARHATRAILITGNRREASSALGQRARTRALTIDDVIAGRARGLVILDYIATDLALKDTRWRDAERELHLCLLTTRINDTEGQS